jgi:hypothetical protein
VGDYKLSHADSGSSLQQRCSFVLQQFEKDGLGQFFEVFTLCDYIKVDHGVIDAHALEFHSLVHIRQV